MWNSDSRFSIQRDELEPLLENSIKAFPGKIGLRIQKQFDDGRVYKGTVVCGRKGSVEGEVWWTVFYDEDGDVEEFSNEDLQPHLFDDDEHPKLPYLYTRDTFVVSVRTSSKRWRWIVLGRTVGAGDNQQVLCTDKTCRDTGIATQCAHVSAVQREYPAPSSWEPGTLECDLPVDRENDSGGTPAFRRVSHVHLVHDVWPGQGLRGPGFHSTGKFSLVAAVLSDREGTWRLVQG